MVSEDLQDPPLFSPLPLGPHLLLLFPPPPSLFQPLFQACPCHSAVYSLLPLLRILCAQIGVLPHILQALTPMSLTPSLTLFKITNCSGSLLPLSNCMYSF